MLCRCGAEGTAAGHSGSQHPRETMIKTRRPRAFHGSDSCAWSGHSFGLSRMPSVTAEIRAVVYSQRRECSFAKAGLRST